MITTIYKCERCGAEATVGQNKEMPMPDTDAFKCKKGINWNSAGYEHHWYFQFDTERDFSSSQRLSYPYTDNSKSKLILLCPDCFTQYDYLLRLGHIAINEKIEEFFAKYTDLVKK